MAVSSSPSRAANFAMDAFASLPEGSVMRDAAEIDRRYRRNVTALTRAIPMVLRPQHVHEVAAIVTEAN